MRKRTSVIWQKPLEEFVNIVKNSIHYTDCLAKFGLQNKGNNNKTLKARCTEENIDLSHFKTGALELNKYLGQIRTIPLEEILVSGSTYSRYHLKKRLLKEGLLKNICYVCNLQPTWNNLPLILHLDHINGIGDDNRQDNLRLLCPNCHSQTETYTGRSNRKYNKKGNIKEGLIYRYYCKNCNKGLLCKSDNTLCKDCYYISSRKVERPTKEELEKIVWEQPSTKIGITYGVSSKAIEKWCKSYDIEKPPRGYWTKKQHGKL